MMKKRYVALDVLRGLTVAFMCIVNNPGTWAHMYAPLRHAGWEGCSPTDLVYPFFVFCMGCAMAYSFAKYDGLTGASAWKVLKRGIAIFLVGLLLNLYPFFPTSSHEGMTFWQNFGWWLGHKRIFGVLQRIAGCYIVAGLVILLAKKDTVKVFWSIIGLCAVYTGILVVFGNQPGPFTIEGNVSSRIDVALVGSSHVYHGYSLLDGSSADFDPEGLLGALTGACTALLGFLAGSLIRKSTARYAEPGLSVSEKESCSPIGIVARLFFFGCACLAAGLVLSIWIPISKPLWSASYVFYAGGWALVALAVLAYIIDVRGHEKLFVPAKAMGMNALMAFVLSGVIAKTLPLVGFSQARIFGANEFTSFVFSLLFMLVIFCFQWFFYKKNIVIKL